ncbi:hypothetical protein CK203_035060 [Vitis vinifera]|uniref:Endonuclease/exonuclease/phosphatase domain-containing protein n=1 Tax=Vitis vinifera TaxID=29760 RepID=A0A438I9Q1_VITVI|nr:hypothetical protein CK203_035060 [Vitis vinifera]
MPSSLQVVIGTTCFAFQLWWEVLPRVFEVFPVIRNGSRKEQEVREEDRGASRAGCVVKQVQSTGQPAKVAVPSEDGEKCCRTVTETPFSDLMPTRGAEADTSKKRQKHGRGNNSKFGPAAKANGSLGWDKETAVEGGLTRRACLAQRRVRGCSRRAAGLSPPVPFTKELTEEALLEEASKHTVPLSRSFSCWGSGNFFSFSTLSRWDGMFVGTNGGCGRGCSSKIVGEADLGPLRIIMANGREAELSGLLGSANGTGEVEIEDVMERVPQEITEEGMQWGFEGEIMFLLKRMKERKLQKGKKGKLDGNKNLGDFKGYCSEFGSGRFLEWGTVDSRGTSGGIMVFWDNRVLELIGVYGPTMRKDRECFWNELGAIYGLWNRPWCVAGDFNAILSPENTVEEGV